MIANRAAMFSRVQKHVSLITRPYELRTVCIIPTSQATNDPRTVVGKCAGGCGHTRLTRARVVAAVESGEMRWVDRHHNMATFTVVACGTWQKTRSGPVATMQLRAGLKGRHVPTSQREPELVLA